MDITNLIDPTGNTDAESTSARKAILWGQDNLLSQAVEMFLEESMVWNVIRISSDEGNEKLFQETREIDPDVVILCINRFDESSSLPLQLINQQTNLKVITLGLESNLMQVYSRQNVILQGVSDLLSIVKSRTYTDCTLEKEVNLKK